MLLTLYFPGMSPHNMNELKEFSDIYEQNDMNYYAHEYTHWKDESIEYDVNIELDLVKTKLDEMGNFDEYGFMGKSIGTYTIVEIINQMQIKPKFVILMGLPTGIGEDKLAVYSKALSGLSDTKIILIQNDRDPYGKMDDVRKVLEGVDYEEVIMEGDNHLYSYAEEAFEMVKDLV